MDRFKLEHFEWLVTTDQHEECARQLFFLLTQLDRHYGQWGDKFDAYAPRVAKADLNRHLCTRIAAAVTSLLSKPSFTLGAPGYRQLMGVQRWLALVFAVSPFRNADHIIRNRNEAGGGLVDPLTLNARNIRVFCLCYFPDSDIPLQPDMLWQYDRETVVTLLFALISARALPTPVGHAKREELLAWLPRRLHEIDSLDFLPSQVLHDVVMHCSYADLAQKHAIKQGINRLIAKSLAGSEVAQSLPVPAPPVRAKPVICVMLEWFTSQHSIYRTHSTTLRALRERFRVVGFGLPTTTDAVARAVFDDFVELPAANPLGVVKAIAELRPDIIYYPSVGMFSLTLRLINMRLAPLQLMALGHPATTHSPEIDGVLVEEDFLGDPFCFGEPVIALPKDALPYVPPAATERIAPRPRGPRAELKIAICASVMKINPGFLATLAEIARRAERPVRFCFHLALAYGLTADHLSDAITAVLPGAEVNAHRPIPEYQAALNECDMFLSPFPFGNTNGLVDAVRQGLPGVCLTGPEVHTHIDGALFRRLGLPERLVAATREDYIREALHLVEDDGWREGLRAQLIADDPETVLFAGNPMTFVDAVDAAYAAVLSQGSVTH
jgi:hypothetical protein